MPAVEVRYLVAGGLAVNAHGYLRFTKDIEVEYEQALIKPLYGHIQVRFVSLAILIRMKEVSDRPQDRADIQYLRMRQMDDESE